MRIPVGCARGAEEPGLNCYSLTRDAGRCRRTGPPADARPRSTGAPAASAGADQHLHPPQHAACLRASPVRRSGRAGCRAAGTRAISGRVAIPRQAGVRPHPGEGCRRAARRATGRQRCRGRGRRRIPPRPLAGRRAARHSGSGRSGAVVDPRRNRGAVPVPHRHPCPRPIRAGRAGRAGRSPRRRTARGTPALAGVPRRRGTG